MRKESFYLKIDSPCNQKWSSMTDNPSGKFCAHCSEVVIDFTQLTDKEIIQIIEKNTNKLCGRLNSNQLNRNIGIEKPSSHKRFYKFIAGILLLIGVKKVQATAILQPTNEIITLTDNHKAQAPTRNENIDLTTDTIKNTFKGRVIDAITRKPLSWAFIGIKGTNIGVSTDTNGKFEIVIPDSIPIATIIISYVGYEKKEILVNKNESNIIQDILLTEAYYPTLTGAIVVVHKKKKWWQRERKHQY